jgi:hypothetical protein
MFAKLRILISPAKLRGCFTFAGDQVRLMACPTRAERKIIGQQSMPGLPVGLPVRHRHRTSLGRCLVTSPLKSG